MASASSPKRGRGRPAKIQSGDLQALEAIGENILLELGRRLEDPEESARLPATGLMAIAQKYLNYLDLKARMAKDAANAEKEIPVMELVDAANIPLTRKLTVLEAYIGTLQEDIDSARKKLEELSGQTETV